MERKICPDDFCTGCGVCAAGCPKKCVSMTEDPEGFVRPVIDYARCVRCNLCEKLCPQNREIEKNGGAFYMAWHKNRDVLMASSSGGVFTAVAEWVLERNGAVVGAAFDPDTKDVYHDIIFSPEELDRLRLSKYYQSKTEHIFEKVKAQIGAGRPVLFTGTACQIAAMKSYLGYLAESELLITLDVLCHGTANKRTVLTYIRDKEKAYKKQVVNFRFRVKEGKEGWQSGSGTRMKLYFSDGTEEVQDKFLDTFFVGFNSNIFLRESCYHCKYCGQDRISDFTVADFWGVKADKVGARQMNDGVSVLLVNTERARQILGDLHRDLQIESIDPMEAIPYNRSFTAPNPRPEARSRFFALMEQKGFDKAVKKLNRKYYQKKYIKSALSKILPKKRMDAIMAKRKG